jgi:hypothetical protein
MTSLDVFPANERVSMSLDERIRQLSETIIQEARGPIEAALHHLLADVMTLAASDRDQAVQTALAEASAAHQSALAALREEHERDRAAADAQREQLGREHEAGLAALREQLGRDHEAAVSTVRESLAGEHQAALDAARQQLEQERDATLAALRHQFEEEREAALASAGADHERARDAALESLRESLARDHEAALKAALEAAGEEAGRAHRSELEALEQKAAADREAAVQAVREELVVREESAVSAARTAAEAAAAVALTAALAAAEHGKQDAEARAAGLERERDEARAQADEASRAALEAEQRRREGDAQVQETQGRLSDAEQRVEDTLARLRESDERAREQERNATLVHVVDRQEDLACSDRTLASFRRLDAARSLTEVLAVLLEQAAGEIGRAVILTVAGSRLRGWEARGFPDLVASAIDAPVEPDSIFGLAVSTGLPASTADAPFAADADGPAASFSPPPGRAGLAVPIAVGGRTVAILYADEGGDRVPVVPSSWPEIAEILARHAGHRLEVLTVSHATAMAGRVQQGGRTSGWPAAPSPDGTTREDERREEESARRYARLLISEIKLYNEPAVEQGRQHRDLLNRLGGDIERARRLFEEKIPEAVRQRVDCFDQEVVRTLAGGDPGLLG